MEKFWIEEQKPDGSFRIVWRGADWEDCTAALIAAETDNYLAMWSKDWVNCDFGYAPIKWRNLHNRA